MAKKNAAATITPKTVDTIDVVEDAHEEDIVIEEIATHDDTESLPPATEATSTPKTAKLPIQVAEDAEELLELFNALTKETNAFWSDINSKIKTFEVQHKASTKAILARFKSQNKAVAKLASTIPTSKGGSSTSSSKKKAGGGGAGAVPSGFARPCKISASLASFIGVAPDTELSRTEATKAIHKYIKENNLQDPSNKRVIVPDEVLLSLMSVPEDVQQVTYFNLQRLIKHNFITTAPAAALTAAA